MPYFRSYRRRYGMRRRYRSGYYSYSSPYRSAPRGSSKRLSVRKRRKTSTAAPAASAKSDGIGKGAEKYILAQADPFDENCEGVKIPDANAMPSIAMKMEDTFDYSTGTAQSTRAAAFNPTHVSTAVTSGYVSDVAWSWSAAFGGGTNSSKSSKVIADYDLFRPVAHAVRITSGLPPTTTTGFLHVCVFSQALYNQSTWTFPTTVSDMSQVPGYKRIPLARLTAEGVTIVNRPLDVTSQRYQDVDSPIYTTAGADGFQVPNQWGTIIVAVSGAPASSQVFTAETIIHYECIPRPASVGTATPAAKYSPFALGGAANLNAKTNPVSLDSEKKERKKNAVRNAARGIIAAGGKLGGGKGMKIIADGGATVVRSRAGQRLAGGLPGISDRVLSSTRNTGFGSMSF